MPEPLRTLDFSPLLYFLFQEIEIETLFRARYLEMLQNIWKIMMYYI